MRARPLAIYAITLLGLAAVYVVAGKLGLSLASVYPNVAAIGVPTGIALAALLLLGYRVWPAILLGAFLVHVTTTGSVIPSSALRWEIPWKAWWELISLIASRMAGRPLNIPWMFLNLCYSPDC